MVSRGVTDPPLACPLFRAYPCTFSASGHFMLFASPLLRNLQAPICNLVRVRV